MDNENDTEFVSREKADYWGQVDLYIGGAEHATGHLLYSRFWTKFLYDLGYIGFDEPFKKMINQGMILGRSNFVYRINDTNKFVSFGLRKEHRTTRLHVDVNIVQNDVLDTEAFKKWRPEFADAEFILEDDKYMCGHEVEKMGKRYFNVQNPDDLCEKYGADTLRMYEMFLGPLEQFKPWDTNGITGVHNFLRKFWRLFHSDETFAVSSDDPTKDELKTLHKTLKKVAEDIERYNFNTGVSTFMICVNELTEMKCNKRAILEPLVALLSPYAPHISEELWSKLGNEGSVTKSVLPIFDEKFLVEDSILYPVSFNGKMKFKYEVSAELNPKEVEELIMGSDEAAKYLDGKAPRKVIVVPGRIVNVVV
jgi:leucyl-tRNA synthetase